MIKTLAAVILFAVSLQSLAETLLVDPENVRIEDDTLVWDSVAEAVGYNIYFNGRYFDTVHSGTRYTLRDSGDYWPVAFDNEGNYGTSHLQDDEGYRYKFVSYVGSTGSTYTRRSVNAVIAVNECENVGPGESCIATCPVQAVAESYYRARYSDYVSGGACTTSDIVEADAFISDKAYKCTVPTFSGLVVAQAVCVLR
jgi:hypothetical protein